MIIPLGCVVIDRKMQGMCCLPYPNHPRGCPNFNYKAGCPPRSPLFFDVFRQDGPVFAITSVFPFGLHVAAMRAKHPDWTQRQLECCLYWQPRARKAQKIDIELFLEQHSGFTVTKCPEAMAVNVTETLRLAGIELEWPPVRWAYQVALAGVKIQ